MRLLRLTFCCLLLAAAAPALAGVAPHPVPADPALLDRVGAANVARLAGDFQPEDELYAVARRERAEAKAVKVVGVGTCLVFLVDWSDHAADTVAHPQSAYDSMLFSTGTYPTGSMNDYYQEISYGQYSVGGEASGWHRSSLPYGNITPTDYNDVRSALAALVLEFDPVIDYSQFDGDSDGYVDALFFVHAGPGREQTGDSNDIWSHAWAFSTPINTADGVACYRYSVEPEELAGGTMITIGVFCHEYGHVIGLPDLYDTDYSTSGIGDWGLMSGGSWSRRAGDPVGSCPAHMTAWCKYVLGWINPTIITSTTTGVVLPPIETNAAAWRIFRDGATTGDEYYLVANRRPIGFDEGMLPRHVSNGLPQPEGLAIYHVDESLGGNATEQRRLVDVVEASPWTGGPGAWFEHLDGANAYAMELNRYNDGDEGDLWPGWSTTNVDTTQWSGVRDRDRFAVGTIPTAEDNYCEPVDIAIENIAISGQDVIADFVVGAAAAKTAPAAAPAEILSWDFETGLDGWEFCRSFVHRDSGQSGACGGWGLWFGVDDPEFACPPGYGNYWSDFTWRRIVVGAGATVSLTHRYELELDYDYGYVEARCADDPTAPWYVVATLTGNSTCTTDTWSIPAAVITACDDGDGKSTLDLRLRLESDQAYSAADGYFCGIGWWVGEVTINGAVTAVGDLPAAGLGPQLLPASPNPFNPATSLRFHVPASAREASLRIYDPRGRAVRSLDVGVEPGWREVVWDGRDDDGRVLPSGVFYCRFEVDGDALVRKMALLK